MLSRRWAPTVLVGAGLLAGAFSFALAQGPVKAYRVGFLTATAQPGREEVFRQELRRLGYAEGRNVVIDYRNAEGQFDRLPSLAAELVALKPDVIVTVVTQASLAAKRATGTTPIVMVAVSDPVGAGLVASLRRPGANVTGTASRAADVIGKQIELLRELRPQTSRLGLLWNPGNPVHGKVSLAEAKASAAKLRIRLQIAEARGPEAFDRALATIAGQHVDAVLVLGDPVFSTHAAQLAELALKHRLATVTVVRDAAERGILMSYGPSFHEAYRLAAGYVDRILKGANPAELPVDQGTKFELVINARTARALGLTIPQTLIVRADEVVQ